MSFEEESVILVWSLVSVLVFLVAALALDDNYMDQKTKVWIGRIGLAAPLWPLMAVAAIVVILILMARELFKAARGRV